MREQPSAVSANESALGLTLRGVAIPFGTRDGLRELSLDVGDGEHLALLGPSGAGKTTLLRAIAGLDPMSAGQVLVGGRDVTQLLPEQRGVVYLHQTPMLFPHLSVIDNVGFPLEVRGASRAVARERAGELLERVRLSNLAHRDASALSGGQRHRVALARALAANPKVLLLDEPFNALDPALRGDVRDAVFTMLATEHGPAVILVTHDVDEAAGLADRIAVLLEGKLVQDDAPALLLSRPVNVAVARFLGVPNIVSGNVDDHGQFHCALGVFPAALPPGNAALICRPDAIVAQSAHDVASARRSGESVQGIVIETRERVSGGLVLVRLTASNAGAPIQLLAQCGDSESRVGAAVSLAIDARRIHITRNL